MIDREPVIQVGVLDDSPEILGRWHGLFDIHGREKRQGPFRAFVKNGNIMLVSGTETLMTAKEEVRCLADPGATFSLDEVAIGRRFHWERRETQTFTGNLIFKNGKDDLLMAVNELPLEDYLVSVISSEMNGEAPLEFLKAHAIASRSWLAAMLERLGTGGGAVSEASRTEAGQDDITRWYGREEHRRFHVCADDHCQRYQGLTRMIAGDAVAAVKDTRGCFLVHDHEICDARYYKACGGLTDHFENTWEEKRVPYLTSISDASHPFNPVRTEDDARAWILSRPDAYCNTTDEAVLRRILPDFDRETTDFFRWEVRYEREALEDLLRRKSGIDFGTLKALTPLERGPSGRIIRLKIEGTKRAVTVGKELEIRRWLSESHLYSSAFVVSEDRDASGEIVRFCLQGAGWGHGVGLCQIGAAVMAVKGFSAESILKHYFSGAELKHLY